MDGHRDPVRRISKRRGSKGTKQPRAAVRTQAPVTPPWNPPRAVGYVVVGLILLFSIEAAMAETALITPINPLFLNLIRSEEHTSELQSLMRISYAVFCLKKKKTKQLYCINT